MKELAKAMNVAQFSRKSFLSFLNKPQAFQERENKSWGVIRQDRPGKSSTSSYNKKGKRFQKKKE